MHLEGSCHCGAVRFALEAKAAHPFLRCYCTICRKTAGGGGYAINLGGEAETLTVQGTENISVYQARMDRPSDDPNPEISPGLRHFCKQCGSALWVFDPRWPDLVHPFASAIDTPLPAPPEDIHIMLAFAPAWTAAPAADGNTGFDGYPSKSLEDWHRAHGLWPNK